MSKKVHKKVRCFGEDLQDQKRGASSKGLRRWCNYELWTQKARTITQAWRKIGQRERKTQRKEWGRRSFDRPPRLNIREEETKG